MKSRRTQKSVTARAASRRASEAQLEAEAINESRAHAAFDETRAEREALSDEEIDAVTMNVDVGHAVSAALGAWAGIEGSLDELAELPRFPIAAVRRVQTYAYALQWAHACHVAATTPPERLTELVEQGTRERDKCVAVAVSLTRCEVLPEESLATVRSGTAHRNVGEDLIALGALFRTRWADVKGKCPLTEEDVTRAIQLGEQIVAAVSMRDQSAERSSATARERRRAFVLLDRAFDQARRGLTYVRWEQGDADKLAPSIRANTGRARPRDKNGGTNSGAPPSNPPAGPAGPT